MLREGERVLGRRSLQRRLRILLVVGIGLMIAACLISMAVIVGLLKPTWLTSLGSLFMSITGAAVGYYAFWGLLIHSREKSV